MGKINPNDNISLNNRHLLPIENLTLQQKDHLMKINKRLKQIEERFKREVINQVKTLESRLNDSEDWLADYEMELKIDFYIKESDPDYKEGEDCILYTYFDHFKHKWQDKEDEYFGFGDNADHSEFRHREHDLTKGDRHCYSFHDLVDHSLLGWANILRIGSICVSTEFVHQNFFDFELGP